MNGVEILATSEVLTTIEPNMTYFWIAVGVLSFMGACAGFALGLMEEHCIVGLLTGFFIGVMAGIIVGFCVGDIYGTSIYETRHQVTISEDVRMNDFLEQYEIVSQNGKIFTVREKGE